MNSIPSVQRNHQILTIAHHLCSHEMVALGSKHENWQMQALHYLYESIVDLLLHSIWKLH